MFRTTIASIGDAVMTTDTQGNVTYLNSVAESLSGWTQEAATGHPLETVFRIVNEQTRASVENPAARVLREGVIVGLANHTVLIAKDGTERPSTTVPDITQTVEKTLNLVTNHLYKHKIEAGTLMEENLPKIYADPQQLEQVLVNLYLNAIDAMPKGGKLIIGASLEPVDGSGPMV